MTTRVEVGFWGSDRLLIACDVVRKQVAVGRRLVIFTQHEGRLSKFDRLLWQFEPTAFVPHVASNDSLAAVTPVLLESGPPDPTLGMEGVWLLNLDIHCPPEAAAYTRILEIVSQHPDDKAAARSRWRQYQEAGFELRAFDISGDGVTNT